MQQPAVQPATLLACAAICRRSLHAHADAARTGHAACIAALRDIRSPAFRTAIAHGYSRANALSFARHKRAEGSR